MTTATVIPTAEHVRALAVLIEHLGAVVLAKQVNEQLAQRPAAASMGVPLTTYSRLVHGKEPSRATVALAVRWVAEVYPEWYARWVAEGCPETADT